MAELTFEKATKKKARLRMAIAGPSGSGKTYTSLIFATALAQGGNVALLDTERGSASKYADRFAFDVIELDSFSPERYIEVIDAAEKAGYAVLIIDSLSHAWEGKDGLLDLHDKIVKRQRVANTFIAWKDVTPLQRQLVDAMLQSDCHIIATMRTKTEWVLEENERGKRVPRRVGLQPIQRKGIEYEFDIVADMDLDQQFAVSKTRCSALRDERKAVVSLPDATWFESVIEWLTDGSEEPEKMRTHTKPATRPYPPETVKKGILSRASKGDQAVADQAFRGVVVNWVEAPWLSEPTEVRTANRHSVFNFLFDDPSSKTLSWARCEATLDWMTDELPGEPEPGERRKRVLNPYATAEANAIVNLWNEMAGQRRLEMPDEAKPDATTEPPPEQEDLSF